MDGIVLINKEKGLTSRDMVNKVSKKLGIKKVGHTGTLDPIATGLLVLGVGEGTKLIELLTGCDKDYIAKVKMGIRTDTYDITGKVLEEQKDYQLTKEELIKVLNSFLGEYEQTVPIYSSIKINGRKLYEYARSNQKVDLPKHLVKISKIELLEFNKDSFTFQVSVSSGTYIRSLINDLGEKLGIPMTMEELQRTRIGDFYLTNASNLDNLQIIPIVDAINMQKIEIKDEVLLKKVKNGSKIKNNYSEDLIMFLKDGQAIAIYQKENKDLMRSYRIFHN